MKTHPAPLNPPPVKRLEPILPPMTDALLMNKQRLLNIVYNQLQGIVSHARFVSGTMELGYSSFPDLIGKLVYVLYENNRS